MTVSGGIATRPGSRIAMRASVSVFSLVLFLSTNCNDGGGVVEQACDRPGDEWCEGNGIVACLGPTSDPFIKGDPVFARGVECGDYDGTCVSWTEESDNTSAGCRVNDLSCDDQSDPICATDEIIAHCRYPHGYVMYGCPEGHCAVANDGQAICAYLSESCSDGEWECAPNKPSAYYECIDGTWAREHLCPEDELCVQLSPTEVDCM